MRSLHSYKMIRCTSNHLSFFFNFIVEHDGILCGLRLAYAKHPVPSDKCNEGELLEPRLTDSRQFSINHGSSLSTWSIRLADKGLEQSTTHPCRPTAPTSTEGRSQRHKDLLLRLLTHPRLHHLRSSWHAVDRELEGYLVMRTPFRRKICASGAYSPWGERPTFIFTVWI
jgi:hypothetical protein